MKVTIHFHLIIIGFLTDQPMIQSLFNPKIQVYLSAAIHMVYNKGNSIGIDHVYLISISEEVTGYE